ncbi:hypothetical protein [Ferviditalea candida]|uniref:Uncharacterized protein n=1 Tax=Ferviditalea candida TaxID=3108399 RepID=A0ABU5ZNQ5_9BACL|nr:hypothetical protein [Paenibacillaceae bacterium T2]
MLGCWEHVHDLDFHGAVNERFEVKRRIVWIVQQPVNDIHGTFAERIRNDISKLNVGNSQAVLKPILLARRKVRQLEAVKP